MKWIWIGCLIIILLLLLVFITKLKVYVHFSHAQDNDSLKIQFRAWLGLLRYTINIPLIKVDDDSPSIIVEKETKAGKEEKVKNEDKTPFFAENILIGFKDMENVLKHVVSLHRIIRHFLKKVTIKKFEWHTIVGVGEASYTGMLAGAVWTVKGSIVGIVSHYFKLKVKPNLSVQPHFQLPVSQTTFQCMLQFRIGHAMMAGIKLIKFWKGRRPQFKSKLLSTLSQEKTNTV